jgi:hypothetical protein
VGDVTLLRERLAVVRRLVHAAPVVDPGLPERTGVLGVVDDGRDAIRDRGGARTGAELAPALAAVLRSPEPLLRDAGDHHVRAGVRRNQSEIAALGGHVREIARRVHPGRGGRRHARRRVRALERERPARGSRSALARSTRAGLASGARAACSGRAALARAACSGRAAFARATGARRASRLARATGTGTSVCASSGATAAAASAAPHRGRAAATRTRVRIVRECSSIRRTSTADDQGERKDPLRGDLDAHDPPMFPSSREFV